jgi:GDP-L-fucose synthase
MFKKKIFVAGHNGLVGSALVRILKEQNFEIITKNRNKLNLLNQQDVENFFKDTKIDQIYLAAAKVGGILANNTYPAEFIYENLMIQNNVIHSAFLSGIKKLLFLGSSCIYPKNSNQPMKEEDLLTGKLEPTNEPYAVAKIAGIKMCESYNRQYEKSHDIDYRCIMPTNLYGPGDNYHPENSHVIAGLINRFHIAKINNLPVVTIWGTGKPKREFMHVDDMARASIHIMNLSKQTFNKHISPTCSHVNIGSREELTIKDLAEKIKKTTGYQGKINFDPSKPDGAPRKLLSIERLNKLGFKFQIPLEKGLMETYSYFLKNQNKFK